MCYDSGSTLRWIRIRFSTIIAFNSILVSLQFIYQLSLIPFPFYSGNNLGCFGVDHGNLGFLLLIILLFPVIFFIAGFESNTINFSFLLLLLFFGIFLCFLLLTLLYFFLFHEFLVIILFFILFPFISSFFRIRTAFFFSFFSALGSIFFLLVLLVFFFSDWLMSLILFIFPFPTKIPSFPFLYWLPEVHCEAHSSISLYLAGLLSKLGIFGIIRFILSSFFLIILFLSSFLISFYSSF